MEHLYSGLALGFLLAAPIGPMAMLCIQNTIRTGFSAGIRVGLGIATADAIYAALAAFGVNAVTYLFLSYQRGIQIVGGILLLLVGIQILRSAARLSQIEPNTKVNAARLYFSSIFFTLMNPMTIAVYSAAFSSITFENQSILASVFLVAGVFIGSFIWWVFLAFLSRFFRRNHRIMKLVNILSGISIILFAIKQVFWF
ncbi:MAG TPA: LysE family translocator [Candidatus Bathyarchaeia archaeon]|nr:LysE family translocator [Candidatus Bathyarchaeia archaeon]